MPEIPSYRKELLFVTQDEPPHTRGGIVIQVSLSGNGVNGSGIDEPSTIYTVLPVSRVIEKVEDVPKLGYFPNYISMTPAQRFLYLSWLRNVETPIAKIACNN